MKKIFTLLALTITFSMNAQVSTNSTSPTGIYASAMGNSTTASGNESTAMGYDTTASGEASTAMGYSTTASAQSSTAMGRGTTASGTNSTAMGYGTTASDYGSLVIGRYNSSGSSVTNNATSFNTANTAFVIGNGADSSNKSDAFKVMFNGDTTVSNDLTVSGDTSVSTFDSSGSTSLATGSGAVNVASSGEMTTEDVKITIKTSLISSKAHK